jgi:hypothetical protein
MVMKIINDKEVPIILERPFIRTVGVVVDMREDTLT